MHPWASNTAFGSCQLHITRNDIGCFDSGQVCCPVGTQYDFPTWSVTSTRSILLRNRNTEWCQCFSFFGSAAGDMFMFPKSGIPEFSRIPHVNVALLGSANCQFVAGVEKVLNLRSANRDHCVGRGIFEVHGEKNVVSAQEAPLKRPNDNSFASNLAKNSRDASRSTGTRQTQDNALKKMSRATKNKFTGNGISREKTTAEHNGPASKRSSKKLGAIEESVSEMRVISFEKAVIYGPSCDRDAVLDDIREGKNIPATYQLNDVLTGLCRARRMVEAHEVLDALTSMPVSIRKSCIHNVKTYTIMIDICGKSRHLPRAFSLFYQMQAEGLFPNVITYNSMISACARSNEPELAFELLKEMEDASVVPDKFTFGSLIDSCAKSGKVEMAFELAQLMDMRNIEKDQTIYSALMDACGRAKKVDLAFSVFEDMKKAGVFPNLITFSLLIDTCANAREPEKAFYIFSEAKHWGFPVVNVVVYTALIDACSKGGWPEQAKEVLDAMLRDNIAPNSITFGAYIDAWTRAGRLEDAFIALHDMIHNHRCEPNAVLLGGLVDTARRLREVRHAKRIWETMVQFNVKVSRVFYPALMAMAAKSGDLDVAVGIAFYVLGSGYLRRCSTESEDACSRILAHALIYVRHMINYSKDGEAARNTRQSRMKALYNSTAMTEEEMENVDKDNAFETCISWGDANQARPDYPTRRVDRVGISRARHAREVGLRSLKVSRSLSGNLSG